MDQDHYYEITPEGTTPPKKLDNFSELPRIVQDREKKRVELLNQLNGSDGIIWLLDYNADEKGNIKYIVGSRTTGLYKLDYQAYKASKGRHMD